MDASTQLDTVMAWFRGLEQTDLPGVTALFAEAPVIRNAANPEDAGPGAAERLVSDFFDRTEERNFELLGTAAGRTHTFAWWRASFAFRAGTTVAGTLIATPFAVEVTGVDVFRFDADGRIEELDIIHETTTVALAAAKAG